MNKRGKRPTKGQPTVDYTGRRLGGLTVLGYQPLKHGGGVWRCRCACGEECRRPGSDLRKGERLACRVCLAITRQATGDGWRPTVKEENGYNYFAHQQTKAVTYFLAQLEQHRHGLSLLKQYIEQADCGWRAIGRHLEATEAERRRHGAERHAYQPACRACACECADIVWRYLNKPHVACGTCDWCEALLVVRRQPPMYAVSFFGWWLYRVDGPLAPSALLDLPDDQAAAARGRHAGQIGGRDKIA